MVSFKLVEESKDVLVYWYFPEGDESKENGVIKVDRRNKKVALAKKAEAEVTREISKERVDKLLNMVNLLRLRSGKKDLPLDMFPDASEGFITNVYADKVIAFIMKNLDMPLKEGSI